jgi:hypothetical protein
MENRMTQYPTEPPTGYAPGYREPHTDPVLTVPAAPAPPPFPATTTPSPAAADDAGDPSAKDKAAQTAQAGKQAVGEVAQTATDKAKDVAAETKKQARNVMGEAQSQLKDQAATQHRNAVTSLRSLADELQAMSERSEQSGLAGDVVGQAGERAHSVASWLDAREPGDLVDEVRTFARRRPGAFLLGGLAAGVVAGRLTRGAVAAHSDDTDEAAPASPPSVDGMPR